MRMWGTERISATRIKENQELSLRGEIVGRWQQNQIP